MKLSHYSPGTAMEPRTVAAIHGLQWISTGWALFRKNPPVWIALSAFLFLASKLLLDIRYVGLLAVLLAPNVIAGLAHGAQALDQGKPLRFAYVASGFMRHGVRLVTIGGLSLVSQLVIMFVMTALAGDAVSTISKISGRPISDPDVVSRLRELAPTLVTALGVGTVLSLVLVAATWFAPLLVFFDDAHPLAAMAASLKACLRNSLAFLVFGSVTLAALIALTPLVVASRQLDLGIWLLAPVLVPSIYAGYRDIFRPPAAVAGQPDRARIP
jgi:hypothetical protein